MQLKRLFLLFTGLALSTLTSGAPTTEDSSQSRACSTIVNSPDYFFEAKLAYACLSSVPFNPAVASKFLKYYNDTLQFQSTLTYLKNPPPSYQQPSVDLVKGLEKLEKGIQTGVFPNQYEFESSLQALLYAAHDGHVNLVAGVLAVFTFASPREIVSLSADGLQLPKVYLADDVESSNFFKEFQPSPIVFINGEDTTAYISKYASKNSIGMLEPHADWNQMMKNAALDARQYPTVFGGGGTTFYPGDTISFVLENGTEIIEDFIAIYHTQGNTGPLETGGDFYNCFVLGRLPASFDEDLIENNTFNITNFTSSSQDEAYNTAEIDEYPAQQTPTCASSWDNLAYPECPDIVQEQFDSLEVDSGIVSAYFLNSSSIGVLSFLSFDLDESSIPSFEATISSFLTRSRDLKLKKIVIDLQSNFGGQSLLAISAFKHFFPNTKPFVGSRLRAHQAANKMGETINEHFQDLESANLTAEVVSDLYSNEWVSSKRINANTGQEFSSWKEFFGPDAFDGDSFTTVQQYNLSSTRFDDSAVDGDNSNFTVFGYGSQASTDASPLYAPEDIIILSDGICSSACALFMEMMHHEAGVRVVAAVTNPNMGGKPSGGPMQAPSGNRGARIYTTEALDENVEYTQNILKNWNSTEDEVYFMPNRTEALDVWVTYASINLRDQIRSGETMPRQFAYEAADCRIFYTAQTYYNYTALWKYAADSIWSSKDLCVSGSRGFATTGTNKTDFVGPYPSVSHGTTSMDAITSHLTSGNTSFPSLKAPVSDGLEDKPPGARGNKGQELKICKSNNDCEHYDSVCTNVWTCTDGDKPKKSKRCVLNCYPGATAGDKCGSGYSCSQNALICKSDDKCAKRDSNDRVTKKNSRGKVIFSGILGVCTPVKGDVCSKQEDGTLISAPTQKKINSGDKH